MAPLLHVPPLLFPESVTVFPAQKVVAPPAVIVDAVGEALTITLMIFEFTLPQLLLLVTKKFPVVLTVIDAVVAPLFQVPPLLFPDKVTVEPVQIVVGPFEEITAVVGKGLTVTAIVFEFTEPQLFEFVTK